MMNLINNFLTWTQLVISLLGLAAILLIVAFHQLRPWFYLMMISSILALNSITIFLISVNYLMNGKLFLSVCALISALIISWVFVKCLMQLKEVIMEERQMKCSIQS